MSSDPFNFGPPTGAAPPPSGRYAGSNPLAVPPPSGGPGGDDVFGSGGPAVGGQPALTVARPPAYLLLIALAVALVAGVVALLLDNIAVAVICWLAAGPIAIGLIALFVVRDTWARSSGVYSAPGWIRPLHYATIALCLIAILAPALRIAEWVGRL